MKRRNRIILLFQILVIALLFTLYNFKLDNIFLLLGLIIIYTCIRKNNKQEKESKDTIIFTVVFLIISITLYSLLGIISKYESNYATIFNNYIKKSEIVITVLIVLISELIKPIVLKKYI